MSYIRGKYYTWKGGFKKNERMNLNDGKLCVSIPLRIFDAIVLMRAAELLAEDKRKFQKTWKEARKYKGNIGSWAMFKMRGEDLRKEFLNQMKNAK